MTTAQIAAACTLALTTWVALMLWLSTAQGTASRVLDEGGE